MKHIINCFSFDQLSTHHLYNILQLRSLVFVVEQQCIFQDIDDSDKGSIHMWSEDCNQRITAYLRIIPQDKSGSKISIGRVVVHPDYRKHGLARLLLNQSFEYINQHWPNQEIQISAQSYLIDFYSSLGFTVISEKYLEDGIEHIDMLKIS
jgi:ElaA protein